MSLIKSTKYFLNIGCVPGHTTGPGSVDGEISVFEKLTIKREILKHY